jgi:hypothetical protein
MLKYVYVPHKSGRRRGGNGRLCMTARGVGCWASATFRHPKAYREHDRWCPVLYCCVMPVEVSSGLPDRPDRASEDRIGNTHGLAITRNGNGTALRMTYRCRMNYSPWQGTFEQSQGSRRSLQDVDVQKRTATEERPLPCRFS